MRIYIRHAEKAYKNGKPKSNGHAHDPPLTFPGETDAVILAEKLLKLYPPPCKIITSPFLRTRSTAKNMARVVAKEIGTPVPIICAPELSEYLGNHPEGCIDLDPDTAKHNPPHPENFSMFQKRVRKYHENSEESGVVWIVTHGLVIREIVRPTNINLKPLGYVIFLPDEPPIIGTS